MRITLGWFVAVAGAGKRTKRQRMQARRIKEKGAWIVADSLFGTKARSRRSENELHPELHSPRATRRKERVARGNVRRLRDLSKGTTRTCKVNGRTPSKWLARWRKFIAAERRARRERIEIRVIEHVEDLPAELDAQPLG